jgi:hypothetical protein
MVRTNYSHTVYLHQTRFERVEIRGRGLCLKDIHLEIESTKTKAKNKSFKNDGMLKGSMPLSAGFFMGCLAKWSET